MRFEVLRNDTKAGRREQRGYGRWAKSRLRQTGIKPNMTGAVPPTIETPKTVIGVGTRELVILGIAVLIAIGVLLAPIPLIFRIGLAALVLGSGSLLALGRAPTTGKTFEEYLLDRWRFFKRDRFLQRGAGYVQPSPSVEVAEPEPAFSRADINKIFKRQKAGGVIQMSPLPLSWGGFFSVLSITFLLMLIVWIWTGGLEEILLRYGIVF